MTVYLNGVWVKDETGEGTALNVLSFVRHRDFPLAGLVRLEGGRVNSVVVADRAIEDPICWRFGLHLKRPSAGAIRIDLIKKTKLIID